MFQNLPPEDAYQLLHTIRTKTLIAKITEAALKKGVREDALDFVLERAGAAFSLNANGDLRGPNGLTPEGWVTFVLPAQAPHAFIAVDESVPATESEAPFRRETARERLNRANGDLPTAGFK